MNLKARLERLEGAGRGAARFVWLAPGEIPPEGADDETIYISWLSDDEPEPQQPVRGVSWA